MSKLLSEDGRTLAESPSYRVLIGAARTYQRPCTIDGFLIIHRVPIASPKQKRRKPVKREPLVNR